MDDEDYRKLLIAAALSSGMTPQEAIETATQTLELLQVEMWAAANDEDD